MKRIRRGSLLLTAVLACALGAAAPAGGAGGDRDETMQSGGVQRIYHVHVPPTAPAGGRFPLVLVFHGGGGTAKGAAKLYGFNQLADARGFVVVYPDGVDRRWNDGRGTTGRPWLNTVLVDDVGFVSAAIDHLRNALPIDPHRVYATGMSNGGILSHRLGCELFGKIAAIAPVAGTIAAPEAPRCAPKTPVSVIEFHGTEDRFVPYEGGDILKRPERGSVLSVADTTALWSRLDGCPTAPRLADLAASHPEDGTRIRRVTYGPCKRTSEIALYTVIGGGHTWPGTAWIPLLGPVSRQINATEIIWEFFERHPKEDG
jgi:polyhydroxybutyrate depolymerase